MANPWEIDWSQLAQESAAGSPMPWEQDWGQPKSTSAKDVAYDVAASGAAGVGSGMAGLAGAPADVGNLLERGFDRFIFNPAQRALGLKETPTYQSPTLTALGSHNIQKQAEKVTGEFHKPETTAGEYTHMVGEFIPAAVASPGSMIGNVARYAVAPGIASEAAGQASKGEWYEPYARAGAGLAATIINPSRFVTPNPISAERQAAIDALPRGVQENLTAGQRTGNEFLKNQESMAAVTPGAGGTVAERNANLQSSFNRAALTRVGESADNVRPEVIDRAFTRIGGDFDRLSARNHAVLDNQFGNDLVNAQHEYNTLTNPSQRAPIVEAVARDIGEKAAAQNGILTGKQYQAIRSDLSRKARGSSDPAISSALSDYTEALDDAMSRSIAQHNPADAGGFENARRQYRNMMVIEKAATAAGANGNITPSALANAVKVAHGRRAYARGQGDFSDLAHAGEEILRPLPNSGTAQRNFVANTLSGAGALAGLHFGGGASETAIGAILGQTLGRTANAASNAVINRAIMSQPVQSYLANQLMRDATPNNPTARNLMMIEMLQRANQPTQQAQ
jgi:hypothetical protein